MTRDPADAFLFPTAPVSHLDEHTYVRFPDVHDITPYGGPPSDEGDKAWDKLYQGSFAHFVSRQQRNEFTLA